MKVQANDAPGGAFLVENHPQKPGHVIVRFFENAHPVESVPGWEYDEYTVVVPQMTELIADIETNYEKWLLSAKSVDAEHDAKKKATEEAESIISELDAMVVELTYQNVMMAFGM